MERFGVPLAMYSKVSHQDNESTLDHIEDCSFEINIDHLEWPVLWNIDEHMN